MIGTIKISHLGTLLKTEEASSVDKASSAGTRLSLQGTVDHTEGITDSGSDQTYERDEKDCHEYEEDRILD